MPINVKVIASKLPAESYAKIEQICEKLRINKYKLFQSLLLGFMRMYDEGSYSQKMADFMLSIGFNLASLKGSHNPMMRRFAGKPAKVIVLSRMKEENFQLSTLVPGEDGQWVETLNFDEAVRAVLDAINPEFTRLVSAARDKFGCTSYTYALCRLLRTGLGLEEPTINDEINELFSDIRITSGKKINDGVHYRRKKQAGENITPISRYYFAESPNGRN